MKKIKKSENKREAKNYPHNLENHQKIEEALQGSEKRLSILLENLPDIVINLDRNGAIQYINHTKGYIKEDVIGKLAVDFLLPDYHDRFKEAMVSVFEEGKSDEFETTDNRFSRWITRLFPVKINDNVVAALMIATDISERRKAEEEKDKFLKVIEITSEAVVLTASTGKIIYTNNAMDELFGYGPRELIGDTPSVLNAGPEAESMMKNIIAIVEKDGFWGGEVRNKRKDGTEFTSYARISALKDKDGKIINYISTQHKVDR